MKETEVISTTLKKKQTNKAVTIAIRSYPKIVPDRKISDAFMIIVTSYIKII